MIFNYISIAYYTIAYYTKAPPKRTATRSLCAGTAATRPRRW